MNLNYDLCAIYLKNKKICFFVVSMIGGHIKWTSEEKTNGTYFANAQNLFNDCMINGWIRTHQRRVRMKNHSEYAWAVLF